MWLKKIWKQNSKWERWNKWLTTAYTVHSMYSFISTEWRAAPYPCQHSGQLRRQSHGCYSDVVPRPWRKKILLGLQRRMEEVLSPCMNDLECSRKEKKRLNSECIHLLLHLSESLPFLSGVCAVIWEEMKGSAAELDRVCGPRPFENGLSIGVVQQFEYNCLWSFRLLVWVNAMCAFDFNFSVRNGRYPFGQVCL